MISQSTTKLRVLIVDDTPDIRMLLRVALEVMGGFEVVGEGQDGAEGVRLASELQPDAILLDLAMPVMDGLQATPEILRVAPGTKIVILSGFSKDKLGAEAKALGASAYVEKGASPKNIANVLREVCGGGDDGAAGTSSTPASQDGNQGGPPRPRPAPENVRDLDAWRRRVSDAVEQVDDLTDAFDAFGDAVKGRVPFGDAGFGIANESGYELAAVVGIDGARMRVGEVLPRVGTLSAVLDRGRPFVVDDAEASSDDFDRYLRARGVRSYAALPIVAAGHAQAMVGFAAPTAGAFGTADVPLLEAAVREAAAPMYILYSHDRQRSIVHAEGAFEELRLEWNRIIRHDLRSPLMVINGFATTMRGAWDDITDDRKLELVDAITRNADAMTKLLGEMEVVDRIESETKSCPAKPLDLGALVIQTVADVTESQSRVADCDIAEDLPVALAEEAGQRRVLSNLLENAFKFSPPGETVAVKVSEYEGMIRVSVTDKGRGIAPEDQGRLFQRFSRLTGNGHADVPGTGLGLFICRSLVEAQGGQIWVESKAGEGATFVYTVPVSD